MNIIGLIISTIVFAVNLHLCYEIWFLPDRFKARGHEYRSWLHDLLGFSYWQEGRVNFPLVKMANILLLIISGAGIIVSITGPISY
jgi:hypothetical protein